jgi:hypothetical protein
MIVKVILCVVVNITIAEEIGYQTDITISPQPPSPAAAVVSPRVEANNIKQQQNTTHNQRCHINAIEMLLQHPTEIDLHPSLSTLTHPTSATHHTTSIDSPSVSPSTEQPTQASNPSHTKTQSKIKSSIDYETY